MMKVIKIIRCPYCLRNSFEYAFKTQEYIRPIPFASKASLLLFSHHLRRTLSFLFLSPRNSRKIFAFLHVLHNTKSIDVSFDNISIKIFFEQNYFILDQCAGGWKSILQDVTIGPGVGIILWVWQGTGWRQIFTHKILLFLWFL